MENQQKHRLAEWLDKIQQDSWQLELLVSGFAIFLMLGALEHLENSQEWVNLLVQGMNEEGTVLVTGYGILSGACLFVLLNLILHVILRGVWISSVGLRSVSGDIDFEALRFTDKFDTFLKRRIGSFDGYIERLENLCSIFFAFTFLLVFMLLAIGICSILLLFAVIFLDNTIFETPASVLSSIYVLAGLIYLIDFLTLGWIKRKKRFARLYFPIYRFFSTLTLAPLYRPIYYNLIDNKFGRKAAFFLLPYIFMVMVSINIKTNPYAWFPDERGKKDLAKNHYDDLRAEDVLIKKSSIPSKMVSNGFLEIFVRYLPNPDDETLKDLCPDFKPLNEPGFAIFKKVARSAVVADSSLFCLSQLYSLKIDDSLFQSPNFRFYQHPGFGEKGLLAILDVAYLPRGEHWISIEKLKKQNDSDSLALQPFITYPFWVE